MTETYQLLRIKMLVIYVFFEHLKYMLLCCNINKLPIQHFLNHFWQIEYTIILMEVCDEILQKPSYEDVYDEKTE